MNKITVAAGLVSLGTAMASGQAWAIDVSKSTQIAAAPDAVWAIMGEFCSIADWHPVVAECELEEIYGEEHRRLVTGDGGVLLERLMGHDADAMTYKYEIIESPLPVANYISSIGVTAEGDGSVVTWSSSFEASGASDEEAEAVITGIYEAGLAEIAAQAGN